MKNNGWKVLISRLLVITTVISICVMDSQLQVSAAAKKLYVSESELAGGKQLTFVDMPYSGRYSPIKTYKGKTLKLSQIQNFEFTPDGRYVFASAPCFTDSRMHTMLMRCPAPGRPGRDATTSCGKNILILDGYGHGEVLAITQDDLRRQVYNIWVGCDPGKEKKGHATAIARLTYSVGSNGSGSVTKTVKIVGFRKANVKKGKAAYFKKKKAPQWIIAATDQASNQIVFRLRFPTGYGCYFLSYDLKKLNSALNKVKNNGTYKIQKAAKWQKARIVYNSSLQSFDVHGKRLYISDGSMGGSATVRVLPYKTQKNKKLKDQKKTDKNLSKLIDITPAITINGTRYDRSNLEIEGVKVKSDGSGFYINFVNNGGSGLRDTMQIYLIRR